MQLAVKWLVFRAGRVIRRHGFQAIYVGDYSRDPPAWAYTVGFDETLNHPELTDWFTMAMVHRQERGRDPHGLRVFQLVLPDFDRRLPWEPGYCEEQRRYTAELWRPE